MYMVQERKVGSNNLWPLRVVAEMFAVLGRQKGALVMIEPPGEARVGGIFKVDNGVDVAVEHARLKQLRSFVRQAGEEKLGAGIELFFHETAEEGRGGRAVETMIVIENSYPHCVSINVEWKTC